ncbi:kinase-like domain-containing protein [Lyophyllum atratum]|nr:kinase-like domain-containing protein [Lyophyllum atratum]
MADVGYSMIPRRQSACDPRRIGLWKIGREIGSGASGRVKIARHSRTGQYAAIKIISKILLNSRISLNRVADETEHTQLAIEREIVVMKLLDHPNVMRLYDVWETSTELYLIMEYIQGGELFDYLCNNGKLLVPEALNYFQQIIAAMDYCHRFNIAHRDLKPENILLDNDCNIKIADFGMAAWQANNDGMLRTSCGSPHYAAPEIISGVTYNGSAADIWSCGVILFALLAGKLPFDHEDCATLLNQVKGGEFDMPSDMDPLAQDLISRMLTRDVSERITMGDIMVHPFFVLHPPKANAHAIPNLLSTTQPVGSTSLIDPDIFANLRTLWHGTPDEEIADSLTNDEPTLQKGIYDLLVQYRANHLEIHRDEEEKIAQDHLERKRSRKVKAMSALLKNTMENIEFEASSSTIPPRDGPPTPRRAAGQGRTSVRFSDGSLYHPPTPAIQLQSPSPMASPASVPSNWEPLPALTVPELQDDKMQAFFHQIVQHLNVLQAKAAASEHGAWSPSLDVLPDTLGDEDLIRTPTPSTPVAKSVVNGYRESPRQPETFGVSLHSGTRPLSVKRKPRRPNSTVAVDSSNKENMANEGHVQKRSSLKGSNGRRAGLGGSRSISSSRQKNALN